MSWASVPARAYLGTKRRPHVGQIADPATN
jgi:hypothetical protein